MAYTQQTSTGLRFVVKHGSICEQRKTAATGFEPIEVYNPQSKETITRYIKRYSEIEGFVDQVEYRDTEDKYDQRYISWDLHLVDENGEAAILSIDLNSSISSRWMKTAENIDFSKPVIFRAWPDKQGEVTKTAFFIGQGRQNGKAVALPQKYTRENMGDCPPATKTRKGWSYDEQESYLIDRMMEVVVPACEKAAMARYGAPRTVEEPDNSIAAAERSKPAAVSPSGGESGPKAPPALIASVMRKAAENGLDTKQKVTAFIKTKFSWTITEITELTESQAKTVIRCIPVLVKGEEKGYKTEAEVVKFINDCKDTFPWAAEIKEVGALTESQAKDIIATFEYV